MPERSPSVSLVKHHKRRFEVDYLQGNLRNINHPTFDGGHNKDEYVEAWLLGMRKYF
jgi:hypothetical protein